MTVHTVSQHRVLRGCVVEGEKQASKRRRHDRIVSLIWAFLLVVAAWVLHADRRGPMELVDVMAGLAIAASVVVLLALWGRK